MKTRVVARVRAALAMVGLALPITAGADDDVESRVELVAVASDCADLPTPCRQIATVGLEKLGKVRVVSARDLGGATHPKPGEYALWFRISLPDGKGRVRTERVLAGSRRGNHPYEQCGAAWCEHVVDVTPRLRAVGGAGVQLEIHEVVRQRSWTGETTTAEKTITREREIRCTHSADGWTCASRERER